jgi:hypothetical protein
VSDKTTSNRSTAPRTLLLGVLTASIVAASIVAVPLARPARAATAADCGFRAYDVDKVNMNGGVVDFGDTPRHDATFEDGVVCFAAGRHSIAVEGTVFWDSSWGGCGYAGLGPTYYNATDPPVDSLVEFKVCSKGGVAGAPVSYTFTNTNDEYAGLAIHLYRKSSDGSITHLLSKVVSYGDLGTSQ